MNEFMNEIMIKTYTTRTYSGHRRADGGGGVMTRSDGGTHECSALVQRARRPSGTLVSDESVGVSWKLSVHLLLLTRHIFQIVLEVVWL
jgi:hypothetical protein